MTTDETKDSGGNKQMQEKNKSKDKVEEKVCFLSLMKLTKQAVLLQAGVLWEFWWGL